MKKAVMITTKHRGVFFGYANADTNLEADDIWLNGVRNCIYWTSDVKGFLGLATEGPGPGCKIGPAAPRVLIKEATSVTEVSEVAIKRWESEPWG